MAKLELDEAATAQRYLEREWIPNRFDLRDAWLPVAHGHEVDESVARRQVQSEPCYLWRVKGRLRASKRRPDGPVRANIRDDGSHDYPVLERYGYVWVWYGDPEHASDTLVPDVPYLPYDGGLPPYMHGTVRFDCCSALLIENLLDLTHADFLHADVLGDERADEDRIEVQYTSETVTMIRTCKNKTVAPIMRWFGGVRSRFQDVRAVIHVHVRSSVALAYGRYTPGVDLKLFHPCVSESRDRCRLNFAINSTSAPVPLRFLMPKTPYIVGPQDNVMVGPQSGRYAEAAGRRDLFSRFDGAGARYRFLLQQIAKRQDAGDFSYAADANPGRDVRALLGMPA
ncbi:aromatic ring-hydroxylating dioxygenase subunit alpha [Trinickia fusca]|uniref:Oxygenase n=1 Tax=Trinickia fusca TaxID=2419777 RepID=A0A494X5M1_9BURK|nr:aromatic ring-hydroxylating dioxygenase subunit alpha [Trinickia fusca]RKP45985.1 oxygenase [Trinickia fusca]